MAIGRDHCCLGLHVLLLATLVTGHWPPIHLNGTVRVQRGLSVDIQPSLTVSGADSPQLVHCSFRQVPHTAHLSCGNLRPSWMRCDSSGPLVYQHYGCSSTRDLLYLQLLASKNDSAVTEGEAEHYVAFFSLEVVVEDFDMKLMHLKTATRLSEGYEYTQLTPVFPHEWVGKCYYRIVRSILPTAEVQGMVNSPLPCGYVPKELRFSLLENANKNRSVLFEVTGTSPSMPAMLHVLLFANSSRDMEDSLPLLLPRTTLRVLQFSNTPVSSNLLQCPQSYHQCVYDLPVLQAGAFVPAYSPIKPQSTHTKFTSEDVAAGIVAFIPNQDPLINTYEYTISDYAGHILAQSAVTVSVLGEDWDRPSLRFVTSLQVPWGGRSFLNDSQLVFYIPPESYCLENTFISLMQSPAHGTWSLVVDGRSLTINESFNIHTALENGAVVYQHDGGAGTTADGTVWTVTCDGRSFQLHMSLLIIPEREEWLPKTRALPSTLLTFCGRASPLLLDTTVYAEPGLHFDVNASEGSIVRFLSTNTLSEYPFPPYIAYNPVSVEMVTQFSIEEVQQGLIWYIPECSVPNSLELSVHIPGETTVTTMLLQVLYSMVSLEELFFISSTDDFLSVIQNQPLPVTSTSPVYISTSFLYTQPYSDSPSTITYKVLTPPRYGHICLSSATSHCNQSLDNFTQVDVDSFRIVYRPGNDFTALLQHNDSFKFELQYRDIKLVPPVTGVFKIYAAQLEPLVPPEEQLWMEPGAVKIIPLRLFRTLYKQLQKRATFHIITPPQFGELLVPNHPRLVVNKSRYTFEELKTNRLRYDHNGGSQDCSDAFTIVASNSTHNISKTIVIAIRRQRTDLIGLVMNKFVLAQDNFVFTSQDMEVYNDFCPPFVQVTMQGEPKFGQLRLFQPTLHTFIRLENNSVYTIEDIREGRLWYTAYTHLNLPDSGLNDTGTTSGPLCVDSYLSDPRINANNRQWDPRRLFNFEVTFLQPTERIHINTVFNTHDIYFISWLPEKEAYGYVLRPDDIHVDSTPDLQAKNISVKILIKDIPKKGWIKKDNQIVTEFYLHQLGTGQLHYMPHEWWIWMASSDSFTISILLETHNASVFINTIYNHSIALAWSWVNPTHTSYLVRESDSPLELTFRRSVDNGTCPGYESSFFLGFSPSMNATLSTNCSSQWTGDACIDSLDLSFPPGSCSLTVEIEVAQDSVLETREQILMYIANCTNCASNVTSSEPIQIVIDDTDDYAYIDVIADAAYSDVHECGRELNVEEGVGEIVLTLTRTWNVDHEVSVSCYTRAGTATDDIDFEQLDHDSTVTFAPNQTSAECVVNIYDDVVYEGKERFYVLVAAAADSLVITALSETPLCIYIIYDPNDAPTLSFQRQPLIVHENEGSRFSIFRHGVNLHLSTYVCYQVLLNGTSMPAVAGDDFTLISGVSQTHDQSCVTFAPNQTEAARSIVAYEDEMLEGTEFVFLELLHTHIRFGELGWPVSLNVTILDETKPANISLSSSEFHIEEREGLQQFSVVRSGSIDRVNKVLCKLKPIDATAQVMDETRADFVVPHRPETITFQPRNTTEYCTMWLINDDVYEGVERLYLELDYTPMDTGVRIFPGRRRAIIYIHDSDDEPKVWFSSINYTVQEPLSNFDVDRRCVILTLLRGGDLSLSVTISYTTIEDSARPGEHYVPVEGTIRFEPNEHAHNLTVPILSSEDSSDVSFRVTLQTNETARPTNGDRPLPRVAEPSEARVVVVNTPLTGVLFPDVPRVVSLLPNGSYATDTPLYYNAPIICVDPCDEDFETITNLSYTAYCRDQQIDSSLTEYTWYTSSDETFNYQPVQQATIFTSSKGKMLESVYLNQGMYVRCSVKAVTTSGTLGGIRHSSGVFLSRSALSAEACDPVSSFFELYKSDGFTGHPEELLRLTVVLKHYDNYVPLVSSRPFDLSDTDLLLLLLTRPYSRDQHSCSNLVENGPQKASFLTPPFSSSTPESSSPSSSELATARMAKSQLLYQHFNSSKCHWEFQVWLPLSLLINSTVCDAHLSEEEQMSKITLPLYYAYVHIRQDGGISVLPLDSHSVRVRARWPLGHKLSIPFDTYPHTASGAVQETSTHIFPVMTRLTRGLLTISFYSIANVSELIVRVEVLGANNVTRTGQLLYSSASSSSSSPSLPSASTVRQAWMMRNVPSDKEGPISLHLWRDCPGDCTSSPLAFSWFLSTTDTLEPRIAPQINGVLHMSDELIESNVWLQPYYHLRANHALYLESVTLYLCADSVNNITSCTHSQIWTIMHHNEESVVAAGFDMKPTAQTAMSINITFSTEPLHQLGLTARQFQLQIKCSIQDLSEDPNATKSPIPLLLLSFHLSNNLDQPPPTPSAISPSTALLASSIAILLTAAVLVVVVLAMLGFHWRWQARRKQTSTAADTGQAGRESNGSSEHMDRNVGTLRKSSSTMCFPTVEKVKTSAQQSTPDKLPSSTTGQMTGQIDRGTFLSKSLPNVFLASIKEGQTRRRQRKNVRVKAIYTLQASLNKKRAEGGGGGGGGGAKDLGTVETNVEGQRNNRGGTLQQGSCYKELFAVEQGREKDDLYLQACVIQNTLHVSPIQVCVQPLTGEVDASCTTDTTAPIYPQDSTPNTEL